MSDQQNKQEEAKNLNIEISEEMAGGIYANLAVITHSTTEFVIDFITIMPGMQRSSVRSRIITNPMHAKRLLLALQDNIKRYESTFGVIKEAEAIEFPIHIGTPTIQA